MFGKKKKQYDVICAWCKKPTGTKTNEPGSHSICDGCMPDMQKQIAEARAAKGLD